MKPGTWTTRDGREIPLAEMTDEHIVNAVRFFRARGTVLTLQEPPPKGPLREMKKMVRSQLMHGVRRRLKVIEAEAKRRNLDAAIRARVEGASS